jgi:hypothetical protein
MMESGVWDDIHLRQVDSSRSHVTEDCARTSLLFSFFLSLAMGTSQHVVRISKL